MTTTPAEQIILQRFREKCRLAGGPRAGFVLRHGAVMYVQHRHPEIDLEEGVASLIERGLLKASESGDFLFLSEAGVEALSPA